MAKYHIKSIDDIEDININGKKVLLRLDVDLPLDKDGAILDDFRLRVHLSTIDYLLERKASIVIMGHFGRPDGKVVEDLRLRPIYTALAAILARPIAYCLDHFGEQTEQTIKNLKPGEVAGLENLRFDPGEETNSRTFAQKLANYGDVYVDDAFSTCHREHASIVAITEFLPSFAGLHLEKEYTMVSNLLKHPAHPFVAIIGGAKVEDKLPAIENLSNVADNVLTGGMVANIIAKSQGQEVGEMAADKTMEELADRIYKKGQGKVLIPTDFSWEEKKIVDIGVETVKKYTGILAKAKTVFWSGNLGITENKRSAVGSAAVAEAMVKSGATTIIGGGNTGEFIEGIKLAKEMTYIATGGGATLALISGKKLPGIEPFL